MRELRIAGEHIREALVFVGALIVGAAYLLGRGLGTVVGFIVWAILYVLAAFKVGIVEGFNGQIRGR